MKKDEAIQKMNGVIKKFGTRLDFKKGDIHWIRGKLFYYEGKLPDGLNLDYAGMPLGTFDKKELFKPSLMLLEEIGKNTERAVILDDKKAWLFSCNRDIFGTGKRSKLQKRDFVLVRNQKSDILGFAIVKSDGSNVHDVWLENGLDVGDYLRRESRSDNKRFK